MKLQLLGRRIAIRELPVPEQTVGGIIVPATVPSETIIQGEVVAIGSGFTIQVFQLGEKILVGKWATTATNFNGENLLIVSYPDVIAIIRD